MTPNGKAFLIVAWAAFVILVWMGRIDTKPSPTTAAVYVTDRWTGIVYFCGLGTACETTYSPLRR